MAQSLDDIAALISDKQLPPVQRWQPDCEGDMDMVIKRDGSWQHEGGVIHRKALVRLFASILRREPDGRYCLVTPAEKLFIQVEDAPFIAISLRLFNDAASRSGNSSQAVVFETNVGDNVIVDQHHGVHIDTDAQGNPRPYVHVRDGLNALLGRSVYYELVDACVAHENRIGFWSKGDFFALGSTADQCE